MKQGFISLAIFAALLSSSYTIMSAYAQSQSNFPVLLIHGYDGDKSSWKTWDQYLDQDKILHNDVTFPPSPKPNNDKCGSVDDHAKQLVQIIKNYEQSTHTSKLNIVAHSKGGLDTRKYLTDNLNSKDIANFIMIGTPNTGSPVADKLVKNDTYFSCMPGALDLLTTSPIAKSTYTEKHNPYTNYYTIAGNWKPTPDFKKDPYCTGNAIQILFLKKGAKIINTPSDGLVPLDGAHIPSLYTPVGKGEIPNCHISQQDGVTYKMVKPILTEPIGSKNVK